MTGRHCRGMDVIAGLMQEDLEVTNDGIGPLPAFPDTPWSRDFDPAFTCCPHTMVDVNAKRKLGCAHKGIKNTAAYQEAV